MQSFGTTDLGQVRKLNEDYYFHTTEPIGPLDNLFIVADGMGGHNAGEVASRMAVEVMVDHIRSAANGPSETVMTDALKYANLKVFLKSIQDEGCYGMGTTLVACTVEKDALVAVNVGDSRIYLLDGGMNQLSVDHSVVEELVQLGAITREEARIHPERNMITRSIGINEDVEVDTFRIDRQGHIMALLCSDGLTGMLTDDAIKALLVEEGSLIEKGKKLVEKANEAGGWDNITVLLVDLVDGREAI